MALLKPLLNLDDVVVLLNKDRLQPPLDIVLALLRLLLLLVVVARSGTVCYRFVIELICYVKKIFYTIQNNN